jgi:hypothetical protein
MINTQSETQSWFNALCHLTVGGMCSCRLHRAGMRFCRVMVRAGVRFHGKLSRWPAKTMAARALAGRPMTLS